MSAHNQIAVVPKTHSAPTQAHERPLESEVASRENDIAKRAYERFVARGSVHGFDTEDWISAERELQRRG
jgi:hypothetical protein